jgi:hypothetical protein
MVVLGGVNPGQGMRMNMRDTYSYKILALAALF